MALIPQNQHTTIAAIDRAVEASADDGLRPHLGASLIGGPCDRALWYSFRWATIRKFTGRMLRLFERGQREEEVVAKLLRKAGVTVLTVDPATGKQFNYSEHAGHAGGSMDGALHGLVEAPKKWHVFECKTHKSDSFAYLRAKGVKEAKPEHYAQMQLYMHWSGMDRAFYLAVNKNDDELYSERVEYDRVFALQLIERAKRVIEAKEPPAKLSQDPAWYQCKFCDHRDICHGNQLPLPHCRTCAHATPEMTGDKRWSCARWKSDIPVEAQKAGCDEHRYIPALVTYARAVDASETENWIEYELPDGRRFRNGTKARSSYPSRELVAMVPGVIGDENVEQMRQDFNASVTTSGVK